MPAGWPAPQSQLAKYRPIHLPSGLRRNQLAETPGYPDPPTMFFGVAHAANFRASLNYHKSHLVRDQSCSVIFQLPVTLIAQVAVFRSLHIATAAIWNHSKANQYYP